MNNCLLSANFVMVMGIFLDHVRKNLRNKQSKRRETNGLKFKKLVQQSKEIKKMDKKDKWGRASIPLGISIKKMEKI